MRQADYIFATIITLLVITNVFQAKQTKDQLKLIDRMQKVHEKHNATLKELASQDRAQLLLIHNLNKNQEGTTNNVSRLIDIVKKLQRR